MDKPVIDDAMVRRALAAANWPPASHYAEKMRPILVAALSPPPPEPEIPVSDRMMAAGEAAYLAWGDERTNPHPVPPYALMAAYRAMERERRREVMSEKHPVGFDARAPTAKSTWAHSRGDDSADRHHRRSTDPGGYVVHSFSGLSKVWPMRIAIGNGISGELWAHKRPGDGDELRFSALRGHRRKDDPA